MTFGMYLIDMPLMIMRGLTDFIMGVILILSICALISLPYFCYRCMRNMTKKDWNDVKNSSLVITYFVSFIVVICSIVWLYGDWEKRVAIRSH